MKIAYLILCHKNPEQINRLIEALSTDETDFYVHIDKKAENFYLPEHSNVYVLPENDRVDVCWGTASMITATFRIIHMMFEQEKKYDYAFLISGQDFPIKSNQEISRFLTERSGINFIETIPHSDVRYLRYKKRNDIFYPKALQGRGFFARAFKKLYIYLTGGGEYTLGIFRRKNILGMTYEFGSQWWCLTYECLKWIADYVENNTQIMFFFKNALTPDECFFQTLFMSSPYKDKHSDYLHYIDWSEGKNSPKNLKEEDFESLVKSEKLMARKFAGDDKIINKLSQFRQVSIL